MSAPGLELAEIVQAYGSAYLARYGKATFPEQRRVLRNIVICRTAALGGHVKKCDQCGHTDTVYDSCRNRKEKIALCRRLLGLAEKPSISVSEALQHGADDLSDVDHFTLCPVCKKGHMVTVETIKPEPVSVLKLASFLVHDTR